MNESKVLSGSRWSRTLLTVLAWAVGLLMFFPVLWMVLTGFKQERDAFTSSPKFIFSPTLDQFDAVFSGGAGTALANSAWTTIASTVLVLLLAVPAAYALSMRPVEKWQDVLFFFLSTRMLPVVGAIVPIYVIARDASLLDNVWTLVVLYTAMNLPIAVWMLRSFMLEVPGEILEAARVDGADTKQELQRVLLPVIAPGIAATALICVIFAWNEFLLAVNLTSVRAQTVPVYLVGFITSEGAFWARLSAAATLAAIPVLLAGWLAQRYLVRGLTLGAVK
jgi:sorbitol/mannitol transport system permease protein